MSDGTSHPERCAALAADLPLLALGTLDGRGRADVLHHVDTCPRCRTELEELSALSEALQQLAPSVQPPLGFESRVVARHGQLALARRRSSRRMLVGVAAALVVLGAVAAVAVHSGRGAGRSSVASAPVTADLLADGKVVGSVVVSPGSPPWMLMTIQGGQWEGTVTCQVTLADGTVAEVGSFTLSGAYPSWAVQLPSSAAVVSARVLDASGAVLAAARLHA